MAKEKEPILAVVNKADSSSTPPQHQPCTRSVTGAQARRLGTPIQFRNLDEVLVECDGSDDEASFVQRSGCSTSPRTLSSLYPNQYSVVMVDNDECKSQTEEGPDLSYMVKQNSDKISFLENGQKKNPNSTTAFGQ